MSGGKNSSNSGDFANVVASMIEQRRCGLVARHRSLGDKVATMERSIPALMAYNMWMSDEDASPLRIREILNEFSPRSDPVDKLLSDLKNAVKELRQETTRLHDNIIEADVKLEETGMELESVESANREMEEKLLEVRNRLRKHPSLRSIRSEDLTCLKKIRRLAEEEFQLKSCIKELERREMIYRERMDQLLSSRKESEPSSGKIHAGNRRDVHARAKKKKGESVCSCPMAVTKTRCDCSFGKKRVSNGEIQDSDSDDVFCECCCCDCEDSDAS